MNPKERYKGISREELVERLSAAEDLCLMFGWSAAHDDTDRDIAAYVLWSRWHSLAGKFTDPRNHPHLSDKAIAPMVRKRREEEEHFRRLARSIVVGGRK
jgi:hypothetical protein